MTGPDQDRRKVVKAIVKGMVYTSPFIASMAAPTGLLGQGPSGMMMTICDYIPILCWIFGDSAASSSSPQIQQQAPGAPGGPAPGQAPPTQPLPPPPSRANPPPGAPPRR